jgi:hypothetical protein
MTTTGKIKKLNKDILTVQKRIHIHSSISLPFNTFTMGSMFSTRAPNQTELAERNKWITCRKSVVDAYKQYKDSDESEAALATARTSIEDKCDATNDMFYAWSTRPCQRTKAFDWMRPELKEDMGAKMEALRFDRPPPRSKHPSSGPGPGLVTSKKSGGAKRHARRRRTRRRKRLQHHL